jgi:hypothetical protein
MTTTTNEQVLTWLRAAPTNIAAATAGVSAAQLRAAPAEGAWSAVEVLAHLRTCADIWGGAITRILNEDRPAFKAISPRTWLKQTDYPSLEFVPSFAALQAQRAALLAVLEGLPPEGWERTATVTAYSRSSERNVFYYAEWLARHERPHVEQIAQIAEALSR